MSSSSISEPAILTAPLITETTRAQAACLSKVLPCLLVANEELKFQEQKDLDTIEQPGEIHSSNLAHNRCTVWQAGDVERFNRRAHTTYVNRHFNVTSCGSHRLLHDLWAGLDASKPWIVYWSLASLIMLEEEGGKPRDHRLLPPDIQEAALCTLNACQNIENGGGYGGGHGQISHLATTYAAVHALAIIGTQEAFESIHIPSLTAWLHEVVGIPEDGSFIMHEGGEVDVRGSFCAAAVAALLGIDLLGPRSSIRSPGKMAAFIGSCQSYEGGLSALPGNEAHGGYMFCGLAALCLLAHMYPDDVDVDTFLDISGAAEWVTLRQMNAEGGFQGRCHKLVDGCYSFWQGSSAVLLECLLSVSDTTLATPDPELFDSRALINYILYCCQATKGGLLDKPGKWPDLYHTCYVLSGLSLSQHSFEWDAKSKDFILKGSSPYASLTAMHPVHNIPFESVARMKCYFAVRAIDDV